MSASAIMGKDLRTDCHIKRAYALVFNGDWAATLFLDLILDADGFNHRLRKEVPTVSFHNWASREAEKLREKPWRKAQYTLGQKRSGSHLWGAEEDREKVPKSPFLTETRLFCVRHYLNNENRIVQKTKLISGLELVTSVTGVS